MTALFAIILLILAIVGVPLFLVISAAALLGFCCLYGPADEVNIPATMVTLMFQLAEQTAVIVALPLFTFAGYLLAESNAPNRLVKLSRALLGWVPGGLAFVTLVTCSIFTAFSGATGVTVIALGGLLLPALLKDGYRERFSLGLLTASGSMGLLLPPSLALILFGIVAGNSISGLELPDAVHYEALEIEEDASQQQVESAYQQLAKQYRKELADGDEDAEWTLQEIGGAYAILSNPEKRDQYDRARRIDRQQVSVDNLFVAGIVPSAVMLLVLVGYCFVTAGRDQKRIPFFWGEAWKAMRGAIWEAPIPVIILGGIYLGFMTVTDAAAVTAFYVFVVEVFIYRDLHLFRDLPRVAIDSLVLIGGILLILMCAISFTGYLVDQEVPTKVVEWMESHVESRIGFLLMLNLFLLVVGCLMDIFSATVIVVPLVLPLAVTFGVHPLHLGVIFLTNLQIGYLTPPVGLGLFLSSSRFGKPVQEIFRATFPFLLLLIVILLIITYIPWLSMCLIGGSG